MIRTQVTAPELGHLVAALKYEGNGGMLQKDLAKRLRAAIRPAVAEAKTSIMSMPSQGLRQKGGSLRGAIARQISSEVSLSKRTAKVRVKVRKRNMPRKFNNAPKVVSLPQGWRHPVFRTGKWANQLGKPGWFDRPMQSHRQQYRAAVEAAMQETANRITRGA